MKSSMIMNASYIKDKARYSDLMVLKSNAGYYIGTMYNNPMGFKEPGSRDSQYFAKREEAQQALDTNSWVQRMHP